MSPLELTGTVSPVLVCEQHTQPTINGGWICPLVYFKHRATATACLHVYQVYDISARTHSGSSCRSSYSSSVGEFFLR